MNRYANSLAWLERAEAVTPNGAQTLSKRSRAYVRGAYPAAFTEARGCRLWSIDGREYLDWTSGLCAVSIGYAHPVINRAVRRQLDLGWLSSLPSHLEAHVSERFLMGIGHPDWMVRWVNSGTEASEAAIRVARRITGRKIVVMSGYHGWTSSFMALQPFREGVPDEYGAMVEGFAFNDLSSLYSAVARHGGNVAAVFCEGSFSEEPNAGYLQSVRDLAHGVGALFVLDEVVCGGRWHRGGAGTYYGVTPDLATFGKAIANGHNASCLVGPREFMAKADVISGTFAGNAGSLAAVNATCDVYDSVDVCAHLWRIGRRLRAELDELLQHNSAGCVGVAIHPRIVFEHDPENRKLSLLMQELAARGVLINAGGFNPMLAHGDYEVDVTVESCRDALAAINDGMPLKGEPFQPAFRREPAA